MFATTSWGKGEEMEEVEELEEDAEVEDVVDVALPPWTVDVTVFVTVFAEPEGGDAGGAVDGAKRLFATEAMPAVTKTTPMEMAIVRK